MTEYEVGSIEVYSSLDYLESLLTHLIRNLDYRPVSEDAELHQ